MNTEFKQLYDTCVKSFGADNVTITRHKEPEDIEISIDASHNNSTINQVEVSLYNGETPSGYMHIDNDFTFEYAPRDQKALLEIIKNLVDISTNDLRVSSKNIFGIKFGKKLETRE